MDESKEVKQIDNAECCFTGKQEETKKWESKKRLMESYVK